MLHLSSTGLILNVLDTGSHPHTGFKRAHKMGYWEVQKSQKESGLQGRVNVLISKHFIRDPIEHVENEEAEGEDGS